MKQKLKALASLCLALALTLCLTLPAWAAGDGDAAGRSITQETKGSITLSWDEDAADDNTVTATAYKVIDVNYHYAQGSDTYEAPEDPEFTWVESVATWLKGRETYKGYISDKANDNSVTKAFSEDLSAETMAAFTDSLAAAIRKGSNGDGITLDPVKNAYDKDSKKFSGLEMGSYLILVEGGTRVYQPVFVTLAPTWDADNNTWNLVDVDKNVTVKSSSLGITKTVVDGIYTQVTDIDQPDGKKYAQVAIGDTVTYILEADVPQYPDNAINKGYYISDNLPDGILPREIEAYGLNENGATSYATELKAADGQAGDDVVYSSTTTSAQRPTSSVEGEDKNVDFLLNFNYDNIKNYDKIRVVYTATAFNGIKVVDSTVSGNVNTAYLDYNNDPYAATPTWKTASDTATVYTYGIKVNKIRDTKDDEGNDVYLPGAEFQVYKDVNKNSKIDEDEHPMNFVSEGNNNGTYRVATDSEVTESDDGVATTTTLTVGDENSGDNMGKLSISGLDVGTYILKETKAPDGYNLPSHTFSVTITDEKNTSGTTDAERATPNGKPEYDKPNDGGTTTKTDRADGYERTTITNTKGFTLPTTGGMGTVLFTAGGVVLMGAGLVLLVVFLRRRRAK